MPGTTVFGLSVTSSSPNTPLGLIVGIEQASVSLTGLGWPGCTLHTTPLLVVPGSTNSSGAYDLAMPVPTTASFVGATIYGQTILATVPGTATGGLAVTIGRM